MKKKNVMIFSGVLSLLAVLILISIWIGVNRSSDLQLTREEKEWLVKNKNSIAVACDPFYPPLDYFDQDGKHQGISEDIMRIIEKKLNIEVRREKYESWAKVLEAGKNKKVDMIACIAKNNEREKYLSFTSPYISFPSVIVVNKSDGKVNSLKDLKGMKVALPLDDIHYEYIKENYPEIEIVPTKNDNEAMTKVSIKEVDATISDLPIVSYIVNGNKISNLKIAGETDLMLQLRFATPKDEIMLSSILEKGVKSISTDQRNKTIEEWIKIDYKSIFYNTKFWIYFSVAVGLISTFIFVLILWDQSLSHLVMLRTKELNEYKNSLELLVKERTRELELANEQLQKLAVTDSLTGAYNRRYFYDAMEKEFHRSKRSGMEFSVIMFDIDHFKIINDTYGHAAGDEVLKAVASIIKVCIRSTDVFGRCGGEEFYILLPDTPFENAVSTAERFRMIFESLENVVINETKVKFTASFGVSKFEKDDISFEAILQRADEAVYGAKKGGRNRVES